MNTLQIFNNPDFGEIRTITNDQNEPLFVAADVCRALDLDPTATRRLDDDEKNTLRLTQGTSGNPNVTVVTESGLYSLVLGSRKPEAKVFKRWITHEVIPSIRKHGAYMSPEIIEKALTDPDTIIRLATTLKEEQQRRTALEAKVEEDKPRVLFAQAVETSHTSILVGELAKLLRQNGIDIGQNRLFAWLRKNGYLISRKGNDYNVPTQRAMDLGLFKIKETVVAHPDGHTSVNKTPKVTGKGQQYFINKFLSGSNGAA